MEYGEFQEDTNLPCIIFYQNGINPFYADGEIFYFTNKYVVELYTQIKDEALEAKVIQILKENNITHKPRGENLIEGESFYINTYDMEV